MNTRISPRAARTAIVFFMASGLVALGCSLVVDFDESKIPTTDATPGDDTNDANPPIDTNDTATPEDTLDTNLPDTTPDDTRDTTIDDTTDATDGDATSADADATDTTDAAEAPADTTDTATGADTTDASDVPADTTDSADVTDTAPSGTAFSTILSGDQEVPAVTTTGGGTATLTLNTAETDLTYTITYTLKSGSTVSAAHFHTAAGGLSGGVTKAICSGTACASPITGTWAGLTSGELADLKAGKIYINVHSDADGGFPGGEIRGQVLKPGETLYTAVMNGASEVTLPDAGASSSTGGVQFILNVGKTSVTYLGGVTGFTPSAAHIHDGAAGVEGGVVYTLTLVGTTLSDFQSVSSGDLAKFDSAGYYVNVHSTAYPSGEVRGQITKRFVAP